MALQEVIEPFIWGRGGAKMTPEQIAREREIANAILGQGIDFSPVAHPLQGLARVANSAAGAFRDWRTGKAEMANATANQSLIARLLGGAGATEFPAAPSASSIGGQANPVDMSGNEVFSGFMDTVKTGVTNPYALAAIAATGKHESGFSPKNVNRTWSDPSQSGQPGTAGGIMSWRGPRYRALAAAGDLSPAGQAKFFLSEDPKLIAALNNARSVDEAVALMNNAWRFAGYDRPGGEAARRLATARSLLPMFQESQSPQPVQLASIAPDTAIDAMTPAEAEAIAAASTPQPAPSLAGIDPQSMVDRGQPDAWQVGGAAASTPAGIRALNTLLAPEPLGGGAMPSSGAAMAPVAPAQPASMQVAQAQPQVIPPMAGGPAPAPAPAGFGGINPAVVEALSSPYANDRTRQIAAMLLQDQLQAQAAQRDAAMALQQRTQAAQAAGINPAYAADPDIWKAATEKQFRDAPALIQEYEYYARAAQDAGQQPLSFLDWELARRKAGATNVTTNVGGEQLTPGQKKIDEAFADAYLSWQAGGFADSTKQLTQLNEALAILESGQPVTGAIGALPDFVQPFINQQGTIAKEAVEEVVQRNLREILGAQFTEKEGERLISRAFNPRLPPAENARRVRRLIGQIASMAEAKQAMVDYFDQNGTLRGYQGPRPTLNDLNKLDFGNEPIERAPVVIDGYTIEQVD